MEDIPKTALPMKLFPSPLKHIVGKMLATLRNRVHYSKSAHHLEPLFAARLSGCQADSEILSNNYDTWSVRDAMKRNDESEKTPDMLSRWLMAVNFGAIHTTTMTIANLILDMASSPGCLEDIQAECKGPSQKYGSEWNRVRLADMVVVDSSLRESMRLSSFGSITLTRNVMAPRRLTFPDGTHIPPWSHRLRIWPFVASRREHISGSLCFSIYTLYAVQRNQRSGEHEDCCNNKANILGLGSP